MYNSIRGTVTAKGDHRLHLENQGVEWALEISMMSLHQLPPVNQEARVFTYLHHKEDIMALYGFASEMERTLFLNLITVSGLGPKGALKILSGISVKDFLLHLEREDLNSLSKLPGLGMKTAQKIILQLKGKLISSEEDGAVGPHHEIVDALASMGFDRRKAQKAVGELEKDPEILEIPESAKEQELLRRAIMELSR